MSSVYTAGAARRSHALMDALVDLREGITRRELWSTLGWHEIRQRYRRSVVGPFWLTLSMGVMIGGLAYMYAGLFGQDIQTYLPYIAVGIIVFTFISTIITDGSTVFISSASTILQIKAPLSVYLYQMLWRNVLILGHNMCIYVLVAIFFKIDIGLNTLLAFAGLFLILSTGLWVGMLVGALSARFRDVPPIVASVMQVAFFLTPIFWQLGSLRDRAILVHLNPFYYLVEIVRMPLLGQTPPMEMWLIVIGMNIAVAVVAILFFARYRARIAYWV